MLDKHTQEFDTYLDSGKHAETWKKQLREGDLLGVAGAPTIFINRRLVVGGPSPRTLGK